MAAGIRRIEAVTGRNLLIRANLQEAMLHTVANTLKANNVTALPVRAETVMAENKALAKELGPSGIRVNCVAPGVILTDMCAQVDPETLDELAQEAPLGRNGTPEDVAKAMEYLANAEFITGNVLNVDGGFAI